MKMCSKDWTYSVISSVVARKAVELEFLKQVVVELCIESVDYDEFDKLM